ncbi:hypothetical protein ACWGQ5_47855 [Streptomyces sp. NPDC055722]
MPSTPSELVSEVTRALTQAGFDLADDADDRRPGLRVTAALSGVLIKWTASDGLTALAAEQPKTSSNGMQAVVQTAVAALLVQHGHTVAEAPDGTHLLVSADGPGRPTGNRSP